MNRVRLIAALVLAAPSAAEAVSLKIPALLLRPVAVMPVVGIVAPQTQLVAARLMPAAPASVAAVPVTVAPVSALAPQDMLRGMPASDGSERGGSGAGTAFDGADETSPLRDETPKPPAMESLPPVHPSTKEKWDGVFDGTRGKPANPVFEDYRGRFVDAVDAPKTGLFPGIQERLARLFASENLMPSMGQSEKLRDSIVQSPDTFTFRNMHQTKTSNAAAPRFARQRNESLRLGLSKEKYEQIPVELLPKYGFLQFRSVPGGTGGGWQRLTSYGDDIFVFKTDRVLPEATFTLSDSFVVHGHKFTLNKMIEFDSKFDGSMANPNAHLIPWSWEKSLPWLTEKLFSAVAAHEKWSYRLHTKREIEPGALQEKIWKNYSSRKEVPPPVFGALLNHLTSNGTGRADPYRENYIELQYFKQNLDLSDVENFVFTKSPPREELAQMLRQRGVNILDWRDASQPPLPYR